MQIVFPNPDGSISSGPQGRDDRRPDTLPKPKDALPPERRPASWIMTAYKV